MNEPNPKERIRNNESKATLKKEKRKEAEIEPHRELRKMKRDIFDPCQVFRLSYVELAFSKTVILVSQVYFGSPFRLPIPTLVPCSIMKSSSAIIGVVSSLLPYHLHLHHLHHRRRPALLENFRGQIDPTS